jgi:hypothetical protein|tara:strand:+ start:46 stop:351 length:306 start_codon:yes stop_codon:yes gene_type:complete
MQSEWDKKLYKAFKLEYQDTAKFSVESEILTPEPDERPNMPPIEFIHRDPNAMWWSLEEQYKLNKEQMVHLIKFENVAIDHFVNEKLYCGHVKFLNKKDIE